MKQHSTRSSLPRLALALGCALALTRGAAPAAATSFVMVSDATLADRAPLVVEARILSRENAPVAGTPSTDYLIEVERLVKGSVPGSNLVVRVSGGVGPDGIGLKIWGAPVFEPEERVLLFLRPSSDGTFRVLYLMLGAFHEVEVGGKPILVRNLAEATELPRPDGSESDAARYRRPRHRDGFVEWIADRSRGVERPATYFAEIEQPEVASTSAGFTLFESQGFNLRWFSFDTGAVERWRVHSGGQPGLAINQAINALVAGMSAWNADDGSDISYGINSPQTTTASGGLTNFDGDNVLLFDNPNNNPDFEDDFDCSSGGVLAIGGPWFQNAPQNGFKPILGGDIITNKGLECFFNAQGNPQRTAEQLFGHELGHTLGIGHSCGDSSSPSCGSSAVLNDALMRANIHNDNRGARLNSDDLAAARTLYGNGMAPGNPPDPPSNLAATLTQPTVARLTWSDNSDDETGFRVQQRIGAGAFENLTDTAADTTTLDVTDLLPETTYTWRVRAQGNAGNSDFSNLASLTTPSALPAPASGLVATAVSASVVLLDWNDNSGNETGFAIEMSSPVQDFTEIGVAGPDATSFPVGGLTDGRPYTFRVIARNASGSAGPSNEASATPLSDTTADCVPDEGTLCLLDDRFQVDVQWRNQFNDGDNGPGVVQPSPVGGDRIGVYSFFNPANIELIVKALDGRIVNGNFWFFYGALSTVEYWITVVDTETGEVNTYHNPPDELCGQPDTTAFAGTPSGSATAGSALRLPLRAMRLPAGPGSIVGPLTPLGAAGGTPCLADTTTLCLANDRFEISVDWTDPRTLDSGVGKAIPGSNKTGYFWFFNDDNVELVVKILDARPIDGSFWVFYGALSDVEYTITVHDTMLANEKSYVNPPGEFCGRADTEGFPGS